MQDSRLTKFQFKTDFIQSIILGSLRIIFFRVLTYIFFLNPTFLTSYFSISYSPLPLGLSTLLKKINKRILILHFGIWYDTVTFHFLWLQIFTAPIISFSSQPTVFLIFHLIKEALQIVIQPVTFIFSFMSQFPLCQNMPVCLNYSACHNIYIFIPVFRYRSYMQSSWPICY